MIEIDNEARAMQKAYFLLSSIQIQFSVCCGRVHFICLIVCWDERLRYALLHQKKAIWLESIKILELRSKQKCIVKFNWLVSICKHCRELNGGTVYINRPRGRNSN